MADLDAPLVEFLRGTLDDVTMSHEVRLESAATLLAHHQRWAMKGANNELADNNRASVAAIRALVRSIALDESAPIEERLRAARIVLL